jgi:hypothetical protein
LGAPPSGGGCKDCLAECTAGAANSWKKIWEKRKADFKYEISEKKEAWALVNIVELRRHQSEIGDPGNTRTAWAEGAKFSWAGDRTHPLRKPKRVGHPENLVRGLNDIAR